MPHPPPLNDPCAALLAPRIEQRIVPGLDRISRALADIGDPQGSYPSILIVGTNGKGSTSAMLASVLAAHGLRVGHYTSPHLRRVEERIAVAGAPIPSEALLEHLSAFERYPELSYFETLTAAALLEFARRKVDIAVLEAGLGGRWDATRVAPAAVSLLTNVGTDHREWLGTTRGAIAAEKAVALCGREAIVGSWDDEVRTVILASATPGTPVSSARDWADVTVFESTLAGTRVEFSVAGEIGMAMLALPGQHQADNLRLALAGVSALATHRVVPVPHAAAVAHGIEAVRWPGRLQPVSLDGHRLILDGAHNLEAVGVLAATLDAFELSGRIHLVFSCLDDKPLTEMAALLQPRVRSVTVTRIDSPRAADLAHLTDAFRGCRAAGTLRDALAGLPKGQPILVTGSLRLVGEVLSLLDDDAAGTCGA